jgi:hypothetical protein
MADKWLLATNRPTQIMGFTAFSDENREAVRALAARLMRGGGAA